MTPLVSRAFDALDRRTGVRGALRPLANKVFPTHWSFLLGELALVSFGILVATGIFLTFFYRASIEPVAYDGTAPLYQGRTLPAVFESIVRLSHDVPGGLLVRRLHRIASHVFVAAVLGHLIRIVLTGAFRRPREVNHVVGTGLLLLVVTQAYIGHNMVWDVLAGTSLRIAYTLFASVPLVGPDLAVALFGSTYPTSELVGRLHVLHILVIPLLLAGGVGIHLLLVLRQTHSQRPHEGVDGRRHVVGEPMWPWQASTTTTMALGAAAIMCAAAVLVPFSDVDLHGPYVVAQATNAAQPDWFLFWVEGALRLYPGLDLSVGPVTISGPFVAGVALPLTWVLAIAAYPFIERSWHAEEGDHHAVQHPLDVPLRAGIVAAALVALTVLTVAAGNDVIARELSTPTETVVWVLRVLFLVAPPAAFVGATAYARRHEPRWVDWPATPAADDVAEGRTT